jgi:hypothetical protein
MGSAELVENLRLQSIVMDEFSKRGLTVTTVNIHPVGDDGAWRIGQGTYLAHPGYSKCAREIEIKFGKRYRLKR